MTARTAPAKVSVILSNREYIVNCQPGQEPRLRQLVDMIQREMDAVADKVGNATEPRHLMLTCLSLADKLLEARSMANAELTKQEDLFVAAVNHLKGRVENLASQVGRA
ncbi:MAG: cell division protein ZapA [Alphaproteobacteria bacterium]|nr:cell division protein ZapA [Alphaproteobacteria bacterium]